MKWIGWHLSETGKKAHCWVKRDDSPVAALCGRTNQGRHIRDDQAPKCRQCERAYREISEWFVARRLGYEVTLDREEERLAFERAQDVLRTEATP